MTLYALLHGIVLLSLPWLALEVGAHLLDQHVRSGRARLPLLHLYSRLKDSSTTAGTTLSRGALWIKVETCALNTLPSAMLSKVGSNERPLLRSGSFSSRKGRPSRYAGRLYDVGVLFALFALLASVTVIVWGAFNLIGEIVSLGDSAVETVESHSDLDKGHLLRRRQIFDTASHDGTPVNERVASSPGWSPKLTPLIPGLTLPWSHFIPLCVALLVTQVIHEAGHAICGALHDLHPLRTGVILFYPAIPGAFVVLPNEASRVEDDEDAEHGADSELELGLEDTRQATSVSVREKMRIISAGVWHNALTAAVLGILLLLPFGNFLHALLFNDAGGIRVISIDRASPLTLHLTPGSLLTHLDDIDLSVAPPSGMQREMLWERYLAYRSPSTPSSNASQGWCISSQIWQSSATSCCDRYTDGQGTSGGSTGSALCFVSRDGSQGRCIEPTSLAQSKAIRCSVKCSRKANGAEQICVSPDEREELLRITVADQVSASTSAVPLSLEVPNDTMGKGASRVVLFQGNRYAVRLAMDVSSYDFRFGEFFWPQRLFDWCASVVRYTFTLSLAMALFNMLPLPTLDGDAFLAMLFACWLRSDGLEQQALAVRHEDERQSGDDLESRKIGRDGEHGTPVLPTQRRVLQGQWLNQNTEVQEDEAAASHASESINRRPMRSLPGRKRQPTLDGRDSRRVLRPFWPRAPPAFSAKTLAQIHARIRWTITALAAFVLGGSIVLHIVQSEA